MTLPSHPAATAPGRYETDVVVVGAGVAGLFTAVRVADGLDIVVVDKGEPRSGSSPLAQGGLAAAIGPGDSPALHAEDTLRAGDGLCDPAAVHVLASEAPDRVRDLLDLGARFDGTAGQPAGRPDDLHLAREGGQSTARSVHRADATGAELVRVLRTEALPRVQRLAGTALRLAQAPDGRVTGVWIVTAEGLELVRARVVVLATGGCGGLFAATTNRDHATADGVALAHTAGAAVRDQEFVQFHPTGLAVTGTWRLLLTEALRGAGATLHDHDGHRFLLGRHPDAELAPRHVVAKAILDQPGGAWLDATHLGPRRLEAEFPTVLAGARRHGFDLAAQRVPVTPAAHYMVGGIRTDLDGRTSLPGLYAVGEVASTGAHGANRMAGNSLAEAVVFGARAATALGAELCAAPGDPGEPPRLHTAGEPRDHARLRDALRQAMWKGAGPVRDAASLAHVAGVLDDLDAHVGPSRADAEEVELRHALTTAHLIVGAARLRTESRGGHWRRDHPEPDPEWAGFRLERT